MLVNDEGLHNPIRDGGEPMVPIDRRHALYNITALAGGAIISGCAINPVTGKREFMLMTQSQEQALGDEAHGQIIAEYGAYKNPALQEWFTAKGSSIAAISHRPNLPWKFTVLDSPVVNAFAIPGGYVYVTRGILGYFNDEAQFAGVLAHEIGHVTARHSAANYSKTQVASLGLALGSAFSEQFRKYSQFVSLGTSLLFLKYSRDDERQADELGVEYSSEAGYDATHMSDFFQTLERLQPSGGSLPAWASTHPDHGSRVRDTRSMALAYQKKHPDQTFAVRSEEYLDTIDGIVFGDDPRNGYVTDGYFNHPTMKFRFPVPGDWEVSNQQREVRMSTEAAILIFTLAEGDAPNTAANAFIEKNGITLTDSTPITINGMTGVKTTGVLASEEQELAVESYFIGMGDSIYAFHGLTEIASLATYAGVFRQTAYGFSRLTDSSLINVTPDRIELRSVPRAMTFIDAVNSFGVPEDRIETLAIMNAVERSTGLPSGVRLKIVTG